MHLGVAALQSYPNANKGQQSKAGKQLSPANDRTTDHDLSDRQFSVR
jgi:hypothetical protein